MVLQILRNNHMKANRKKCAFGSSKVDYLEHISQAGVAMDLAGVVVDWLRPRLTRDVRGFLGLTGCYK